MDATREALPVAWHASGAEAMWGRETMAGMANGGLASGNRLDGEVGYGLPVGSRFVGTPRVGFSTSEYGRDYRVGYGLGVLNRERLNLALGVDADCLPSELRPARRLSVLLLSCLLTHFGPPELPSRMYAVRRPVAPVKLPATVGSSAASIRRPEPVDLGRGAGARPLHRDPEPVSPWVG